MNPTLKFFLIMIPICVLGGLFPDILPWMAIFAAVIAIINSEVNSRRIDDTRDLLPEEFFYHEPFD